MKKFIFIFLLISLMFSCDYFTQLSFKEWMEKSGIDPTYNIYFAAKDSSSTYVCYWKNDNFYNDLENNNGAQYNGMYALGEDVYIAGQIGGSTACYWINKNIKVLSDTTSVANAIFAINNEVYVAGDENVTAYYWKNGIRKELKNTASGNSSAKCIYVVDNGFGHDIYIGGNSGGIDCYWKNGNINYLNTGATTVKSIFVHNNNVYILTDNTSFYLKNNQQYPIPTASLLFSIYVDRNEDVYVSGITTTPANNAAYWKNGIQTGLGVAGAVKNILKYDEDLFIGGEVTGQGICYWKNDSGPFYTKDYGASGTAYPIFYVTRKQIF